MVPDSDTGIDPDDDIMIGSDPPAISGHQDAISDIKYPISGLISGSISARESRYQHVQATDSDIRFNIWFNLNIRVRYPNIGVQ